MDFQAGAGQAVLLATRDPSLTKHGFTTRVATCFDEMKEPHPVVIAGVPLLSQKGQIGIKFVFPRDGAPKEICTFGETGRGEIGLYRVTAHVKMASNFPLRVTLSM